VRRSSCAPDSSGAVSLPPLAGGGTADRVPSLSDTAEPDLPGPRYSLVHAVPGSGHELAPRTRSWPDWNWPTLPVLVTTVTRGSLCAPLLTPSP
jgi:hypothetical protein